MQITNEQVEKYQQLVLEEHAEVIDHTKARDELTRLVILLETVYKHAEKEGWPDISHIPFRVPPLVIGSKTK